MVQTSLIKRFTQLAILVSVYISLISLPTVHAAGTFSIVPTNGTFVHSCPTTAIVTMNVTSGQSNAADAIVTYNPSLIEIIDAMPTIPGIQILPGNAFESYAGNTVDTINGVIKLIGYSTSSTVTGTANFAIIQFKPKPFTSAGAFSFTFTGANPYNTTDSNIADASTAYDMLQTVSNASYTFTSGSCTTDTTPPSVTFLSPKNYQQNVPANSSVSFTISDQQSGIDVSTFTVHINGETYTSSDPEVSVTGTPLQYTVTILPRTPFPTQAQSVITVSGSDVAGNQVSASIAFNAPPPLCRPTAVSTVCPTSPTPTVAIQQSPLVEFSVTSISVTDKTATVTIVVTDDGGIVPETFFLQLGDLQYSIQSTPERITVEGDKLRYTFTITVALPQGSTSDKHVISGFIRISDSDANTRIENISITLPTELVPTNRPSQGEGDSFAVSQELVQLAITVPLLGLLVYLTLPPLLLPTVAIAYNSATKKRIVFPRAYILQNEKKLPLIGTILGTVVGRIPSQGASIVLQKYGYHEKTIQVPFPTISQRSRPIRADLTKL